MDEEKQIEEMAKAIVDREKYNVCGYTTCKMCDIGKCDLHCSKYSDISYDCEALYEAGYRKQSDTAKEIFQTLYDRTQNYHGDRTILTSDDIKELAEKYGVKID